MTKNDKKLLHLLIANSQGNVFTGSMTELMENLGTSKSPEKALKALTHTSVTFQKGDSEAHVVPLLHLVLKKDENDTIFSVHINESYLALANGKFI